MLVAYALLLIKIPAINNSEKCLKAESKTKAIYKILQARYPKPCEL